MLFKLQQTSSVEQYQSTFESTSKRITNLPPEMLLNCFIFGLKPQIKHEILLLRPNTITDAIEMAKLIENKQMENMAFFNRNSSFKLPTTTLQSTYQTATPTQNPNTTYPIKKLTQAEMDQRRVKGLCFNCDERYHSKHQCQTKRILLLLLDEPPDPDPLLIDLSDPPETQPNKQHEVSFHALVKSLQPTALRPPTAINKRHISMLVDT